MARRQYQFGSGSEAVIYSLLLLVVMWLAHWADFLFPELKFYQYGVKPQTLEGIKGILLMPLIHAKDEIQHIINNSLPTVVLLGALIYFYRDIAARVFLFSWLFTGIGLWLVASNSHSYHIGMSGVIYALAGFLFTSGVIRRYRPLQGISLFVAFVYGSMIWGIFPMEAHVSWQGHLSGLLTGVILAIMYRKHGPQPPKYQYEIEKELGIDPPDLEGEWLAKLKEEEERKKEANKIKVIYHFRNPKDSEDDNDDK